MSILKGGNIINQGGFGCIFDPPIKCKDEDEEPDDIISKLTTSYNAETELEQHKLIDSIDPEFKYHLPTPKVCIPDEESFMNQDDLMYCNVIQKSTMPPNVERFKLLQMKNGGSEMRGFKEIKKKEYWVENLKDILEGIYPLFVGLDEMADANFCHFDIKPENIVISNFKCNYIDFGLSNTYENIRNSFRRLSSGYYVYPYEVYYISVYERLLEPYIHKNYSDVSTPFEKYFNYSISNMIRTSGAKYIVKYMFGDDMAVYLHPFKPKVRYYYIQNIRKYGMEYVFSNIIKKLDTFSLGLTLLYYFHPLFYFIQKDSTDTFKSSQFSYSYSPLNTTIPNERMNEFGLRFRPIFDKLYDLLIGMCSPVYTARVSAKEARQKFETLLAEINGIYSQGGSKEKSIKYIRNKNNMKHTRKYNKRPRRSRYSRKGGRKSGFGGVLNPFPPGGPYKVGSSTNGLNGGYYYKYNTDPTLQTRILTQGDNTDFLQKTGQTMAPMSGGKRKYRRRKSHKPHKTTKRTRRSGKKMRKMYRTRTRRGGSGLRSFVPADVLDITRSFNHGISNLYRGFVAEKPTISPSVMVQPTEF